MPGGGAPGPKHLSGKPLSIAAHRSTGMTSSRMQYDAKSAVDHAMYRTWRGAMTKAQLRGAFMAIDKQPLY